MALTPEQEKKVQLLPPHMRDAQREKYERGNAEGNTGDPDDPPIWEFHNPFSALWTGGDPTRIGYTAKPSSRATLDFYSLDKDELLRFQELAFQAGLYGSTAEREDIPWRARDKETFDIWKQMVAHATGYYASGQKRTIWDALQDLVENRPENLGKKKKAERGPLVNELPDPRGIEEMIRGVAPEVIGRDADEAFTQDFIAMYTEIVRQYNENKYALAGTEEGGIITAPPRAQDLATFRLRTENPEAYEQERSAKRATEYTKLLKSAL